MHSVAQEISALPAGTRHDVSLVEPLLSIHNIHKSYGSAPVLKGVTLTIHSGEILGLIGENGAGKSTLMKILAGIESFDTGKILQGTRSIEVQTPYEAIARGIFLVHQELNLITTLSVAENLFLGREVTRWGFVKNREIARKTLAALREVGLKCSPATVVASLSPAEQQLVEIAKAVAGNASVIIFDEPTSSLSPHEASRLFDLMHTLAKRGRGIIFISHRLDEIESICSRVVGLRDGEVSGVLDPSDYSRDAFIRLMIGRTLSQFFPPRYGTPRAAAPRLTMERLSTKRFPDAHNSFSLAPGEIVGIAGLIGSGRTELMEVLGGIDPPNTGAIRVDGVDVRLGTVRSCSSYGMVLVPEDRRRFGVHLDLSISENVSLRVVDQLTRRTFLDEAQESRMARNAIESLYIRADSPDIPVRTLSGGNQQKVALAKALAAKPKILLLDEPTRGIDIGARQELYTVMRQIVVDGSAILWVSSDIVELIGMADRILVMRDGLIVGELEGKSATEEGIMRMAAHGV